MRKALYIIVIVIGFLQTVGYLTKVKIIRDIGILTTASPLPIVFTEVKGVETFASDFYLQWKTADGKQERLKVTPEIYSRFKGPYNRRNIYGAAISYGPVLPEPIWNSVLSYGLCNDILENELKIPVTKEGFSVYISTRTKGKNDNWQLNVECPE